MEHFRNARRRDTRDHTLSVTWWRSWKRHWAAIGALLLVCVAWSADASEIIVHNEPRDIVYPDELVSDRFYGNRSHVDYFRLLQRDGDSILIGARNIVFNISIYDLSENFDRRIVWHSRKADSRMCFVKGKSQSECQNYIRVLAKKTEGEFLVCGTNAYKPLCRDYSLQPNGTFTYVETTGVGRCPYNPRHNSTFVFADGQLYSGTVADFQELVPLIFREPLKTNHNDFRHLNEPSFVHSFSHGEYVFFFFRETAVEYMNCGKRIFSRVARVCKNDRGDEEQMYNILWTSFLKSRLNCSYPGEYPFYFDEIQSVSDVVTGIYEGVEQELIYAVFTTPINSIPGSAVCAFSMRDILDTFEGPFKEQKDINSNWQAVPAHKVPEPRPGSCVNDSLSLPNDVVDFVRSHPLMDELIPAYGGKPILMKASFKYRFTKLAVDQQVQLLDGSRVDVIFVATDTGTILKTVTPFTSSDSFYSGPVIVEEIHPFDNPVVINNLQVAKLSNGDGKLIIITDSEVLSIPLQRCHRAFNCWECVALQDPYCGWHSEMSLCEPINRIDAKKLNQNISSGVHNSCPYHEYSSEGVSSTFHQTTESTSTSVEPETCPPCVCTERATPTTDKPLPVTLNSHPPKDLEDQLSPTINEIDSRPRSLDIHDDYIANFIPAYPLDHPSPHPKDASRIETLQEISIAYAEGESAATGPVVGASVRGPLIYSAETLSIAVTTACVCALVVGFICGFLFSRKCKGDDYPPFSDTPYLDSKLNSRCENLMQTADPNMYTANNTPKHLNNLMAAYNPTKDTNNKKANTSPSHDNTLIKPAKCAYI